MRANLLHSLLLLSALAASTSCRKDTPEPILPDGPLTITLKAGQTQENGALGVKLVSIREGRCAREECYRCVGGYATVQVDVTVANQPAQHLSFQRLSCMAAADLTLASADSLAAGVQQVAGYRVGLINMTDLVRANNLSTSSYKVKLLFVKK
jgi:hypothetical protein